jgi:hypothetical protein
MGKTKCIQKETEKIRNIKNTKYLNVRDNITFDNSGRAIAIGFPGSGLIGKGDDSISIGNYAGELNQGYQSISIGSLAGLANQGTNAIAIGNLAGCTDQPENSIVINATGINLDGDISNAFYVKPVREIEGSSLLQYNTIDGEISYSNTYSGDISFNGNVDISGNLTLNCNLINDVSGIYFCDGTYIGHGDSFDISTNEVLKINQDKIVVDTNGNVGIGTTNPQQTLDVSGSLTLAGDLTFENNGNNVMTFSDFSSNTQNIQLPSINNQPVSLTRVSIFKNDISYNVADSSFAIMPFGNIIKNQLNLSISGDIISPSLDISGQYVEIYANVEIQTDANDTGFSLDISGVDCSFFEIIDSVSVTKKNKVFYLTLGPHMFLPEEWAGCSQFVFKLVDNVNSSFDVLRTKIVFKSYYL